MYEITLYLSSKLIYLFIKRDLIKKRKNVYKVFLSSESKHNLTIIEETIFPILIKAALKYLDLPHKVL